MSWVSAQTGAILSADPEVAMLALRRNPRRAHLIVSFLLGKHMPVPAEVPLAAAAALGALVRGELDHTPYVLGFAETATALGHGVARVCSTAGGQAPYAHTTRRTLPSGADVLCFEEEHSHAVEQVLAIGDDTALCDPGRALVFVDDELSSGRTAVNAVRVLQERWPRETYVLASLLDVRTSAQRAANVAEVAELGACLRSVALVEGSVHLPPELPARAAQLIAAAPEPAVSVRARVPVVRWELSMTAPLTGAYGWQAPDEQALRAAVALVASRLDLPGSVLVLGDEEFLYAGQLLAQALGPQVCTSSTTRSPGLVVDEPGYPLRTVISFGATDDADRAAFAYNVLPSTAADRGPAPGFDHVVLLLDRPVPPHAETGLLRQLAGAAGTSVQVIVVASGAEAAVRRTG